MLKTLELIYIFPLLTGSSDEGETTSGNISGGRGGLGGAESPEMLEENSSLRSSRCSSIASSSGQHPPYRGSSKNNPNEVDDDDDDYRDYPNPPKVAHLLNHFASYQRMLLDEHHRRTFDVTAVALQQQHQDDDDRKPWDFSDKFQLSNYRKRDFCEYLTYPLIFRNYIISVIDRIKYKKFATSSSKHYCSTQHFQEMIVKK